MKPFAAFLFLLCLSACTPNLIGQHQSCSFKEAFSPEINSLLIKALHDDPEALTTLISRGKEGDPAAEFSLYMYYNDDHHTNIAEAYFWGLLLERALGSHQYVNDYLAKRLSQKQRASIKERVQMWKKHSLCPPLQSKWTK